MADKLKLEKLIEFEELVPMLQNVIFRKLFDKNGKNLKPYEHAKFSLTRVYPARTPGSTPEIVVNEKREELYTAQPTIYQNQTDIVKIVDEFLRSEGLKIHGLTQAIEYSWEGKGSFHVLPPIIEKHSYPLQNGYIDLADLCKRLKNAYIKDARGNLHNLKNRHLNSFYIDEVSKLDHLDIFNSNAPIINYGLGHDGTFTFYVICDGSHRIDYAIEHLRQPIAVILVEASKKERPLFPYYALPVSFRPTIRLSSKRSERMYHRLERDKIHLYNDYIKKLFHYNWDTAGLKVSKLRSNDPLVQDAD